MAEYGFSAVIRCGVVQGKRRFSFWIWCPGTRSFWGWFINIWLQFRDRQQFQVGFFRRMPDWIVLFRFPVSPSTFCRLLLSGYPLRNRFPGLSIPERWILPPPGVLSFSNPGRRWIIFISQFLLLWNRYGEKRTDFSISPVFSSDASNWICSFYWDSEIDFIMKQNRQDKNTTGARPASRMDVCCVFMLCRSKLYKNQGDVEEHRYCNFCWQNVTEHETDSGTLIRNCWVRYFW